MTSTQIIRQSSLNWLGSEDDMSTDSIFSLKEIDKETNTVKKNVIKIYNAECSINIVSEKPETKLINELKKIQQQLRNSFTIDNFSIFDRSVIITSNKNKKLLLDLEIKVDGGPQDLHARLRHFRLTIVSNQDNYFISNKNSVYYFDEHNQEKTSIIDYDFKTIDTILNNLIINLEKGFQYDPDNNNQRR